MAEQPYGTCTDWLLCFCAVVLMQTPSWHNSRWHKNHPDQPRPTPKPVPSADPPSGKRLWHRVLDVVEQPLFTTPAGVIGGIVGAFFYTPVCLVCDACVLLAVHRSKAVADKSIKTQVIIYSLSCVITTVLLLWLAHSARKATREYAADLVTQISVGVRSRLGEPIPPASGPAFLIFLESDQEGIIETTGLGTGWWIVNKKTNTACSAKRMIYLRVVNMQPFPVGISRFDVEFKRTSDGEFTKVPVIDFSEDSILYTRKNANSWTAYRNRDFLRTEMSFQPLQPHVPVRGWVPLDFPAGMRNFDAFETEFKISLVASDGSKSSAYPPQVLIDESGLGVLIPDGNPEDLSQLTIEQPCKADLVW
jgi:hypothetical protein